MRVLKPNPGCSAPAICSGLEQDKLLLKHRYNLNLMQTGKVFTAIAAILLFASSHQQEIGLYARIKKFSAKEVNDFRKQGPSSNNAVEDYNHFQLTFEIRSKSTNLKPDHSLISEIPGSFFLINLKTGQLIYDDYVCIEFAVSRENEDSDSPTHLKGRGASNRARQKRICI